MARPALGAACGPTGPDPAPEAGDSRSDASRTARGALWFATHGVVVKGSQTLVLLALAATLVPSALGLVALGTLVANVSAILSNLGTASALVYWRGDLRSAARTAVTLSLVSGTALATLLWLAAPTMASALRAADGGADVIRGLTVTLPALAVASVTQELLRRRLQFLRRILPEVVSSVAGAVLAIVLLTQGVGVMALVAGQVLQGVLTLVLAWVVHPPVLPGWDAASARGLLTYGGPYAGAHVLEVLQLNIDYLLVARVLGAVALGQYSLGFRIAYMPYVMLVLVVTGAAFPYLCRRRGENVGRATEIVLTVLTALVAPLSVVLLMAPDQLLLLGDQWQQAVGVLAVMAVFSWTLGLTQAVQVALNASGAPGTALRLRLGHLVCLGLALLVTVRHGVVAVAWTQTVVASLTAVVAVAVASRVVSGFSPRRWLRSLVPVLLASAVAAAAVRLADLVVTDGVSVLSLLVLGAVGVGSYAVVLWWSSAARLRAAWAVLEDAGRLEDGGHLEDAPSTGPDRGAAR